MLVESINVDQIVLDPANARKHAAKNLEAIKGSLAKFGQQKPIVVGKGNVVIAGNGTLEAARALGWKKIQVVRTELTGTDATAFAIADNRTGELAEWDAGVLSETLKSLQDLDFDLGSIGFDAKDLGAMIATDEPEGLTDPDAVPENVETRCKLGDLWVLGNHRLLCGDSTNVQHVERLMGGEKAEILFTSPPYSDLRDYNGEVSPSRLAAFFEFPAKTYFVNLGIQIKNREINCYWDEYLKQAKDRRLKLLAWLIWDKGNASAPAHQQSMFGLSHEWIFVFGEYKKQNLIKENKGGDAWGKQTQREKDGSIKETTAGEKRTHRQLDSVIQHTKAVTGFAGVNHPAQFPVGLPELFIESSTSIGDLVAEPFLGSGSTLIACEKTGRRCFGMELDPKYCDVILARWEAFTGKAASLAAGEGAGNV